MKISSWIKRIRKNVVKDASKDAAFNKKNRHKIERSLLFRMRILGFILLGFGLIFLLYATTYTPPEKPPELVADSEEFAMTFPDLHTFEEYSAHEMLNFFNVSAIFAILGAACLFTSWKQSKNKKRFF